MLARDIIGQAVSGMELVTRTSRQLDVTSEDAVRGTIRDVLPDVVINCAAFTDVDGAESERERAFAVNGVAPGLIATAVSALPARGGVVPLLIHYSTDYVFDGSGTRPYAVTDRVSPLGVYGESKLAGETGIARSRARCIIVRTQWLYGLQGRSFPRTMWERATAGLPTKVVTDQTGRPTYTVDLARATWHLVVADRAPGRLNVQPDAPRILHVANEGTATWYEVAKHIFERADRMELLSPCTTADFPRPAKRPAFSVLDTTEFKRMLNRPLPDWRDALDRFLDDLRQPGNQQA